MCSGSFLVLLVLSHLLDPVTYYSSATKASPDTGGVFLKITASKMSAIIITQSMAFCFRRKQTETGSASSNAKSTGEQRHHQRRVARGRSGCFMHLEIPRRKQSAFTMIRDLEVPTTPLPG